MYFWCASMRSTTVSARCIFIYVLTKQMSLKSFQRYECIKEPWMTSVSLWSNPQVAVTSVNNCPKTLSVPQHLPVSETLQLFYIPYHRRLCFLKHNNSTLFLHVTHVYIPEQHVCVTRAKFSDAIIFLWFLLNNVELCEGVCVTVLVCIVEFTLTSNIVKGSLVCGWLCNSSKGINKSTLSACKRERERERVCECMN